MFTRKRNALEVTLVAVVAAVLLLTATSAVQGDYISTVLESDPIAYWRLEEQSGVYQSQVGTFDGAVRGSLDRGTAGPGASDGLLGFGDPNYAPTFNGSDAGIGLGTQLNNALLGLSAISFESWVRAPELLDTGQFIVATWRDTAGAQLQFNAGNVRLLARSQAADSSAQTLDVEYATAGLTAGEWHHLVGIMDFTAKQMRLYVDGEEVGAKSDITGWGSTSYVGTEDGGSDSIGYRRTSPSNFFNGQLDEVAVYGYALDAHPTLGNRVLAHYTAAVPEPGAWLLLLIAAACGLLVRRRRGKE